MAPPHVTQWLERTYPKPKVDPEWLDACCQWIQDELNINPTTQTQEFINNVENQLLESDFRDSMLEGTGLPLNICNLNNTKLRCGPVLCEVISITEIGHSAFNLLNVRQTRNERDYLEVLASEEGIENDEGPCPDYPRTMLRLELTDGTTTVPAIEFRKLPELKLGETPLGFKLVLKDALVRRGIVFLEPANTILKGHRTEDHDIQRDYRFVCSLKRRLGKPNPPNPEEEANQENGPPTRVTPPPQRLRSPLADMEDPPLPTDGGLFMRDDERPQRRRTVASPLASSATIVPSRFFDRTQATQTSIQTTQVELTEALSRMLSPIRGSTVGVQNGNTYQSTSGNRNADLGDDDFDDLLEDVDDEYLQQAEMAEKAALGLPPTSRIQNPIQLAESTRDVITIDDDEDDKENTPFPTRHVRRRTMSPDVIDISD